MNLARAKKASKWKLITLVGPAAFYIGLLIALIAAFVTPSSWLFVALGVLGVIVGLLNITTRETSPFLLASIAFIVAAWGMWTLVVTAFSAALLPIPEILTKEFLRLAANLTVLIGASAMVISLRAIYEVAKGR
ncbi:MAG: hypothetical protein CEE41_03400 [Hadesarchaea archaeon B3_Hades]|nr:MAG: hypothetical protein CEE41_03400 [Hadesarchaea archaeon B3_Hades]